MLSDDAVEDGACLARIRLPIHCNLGEIQIIMIEKHSGRQGVLLLNSGRAEFDRYRHFWINKERKAYLVVSSLPQGDGGMSLTRLTTGCGIRSNIHRCPDRRWQNPQRICTDLLKLKLVSKHLFQFDFFWAHFKSLNTAQGRAKGNIRLLLTKNPACSFSCPLSGKWCLVLTARGQLYVTKRSRSRESTTQAT